MKEALVGALSVETETVSQTRNGKSPSEVRESREWMSHENQMSTDRGRVMSSQGASQLKDNELPVSYGGRKAARAGSEQRRLNILNAALSIVTREGIRGIRHRSVAKEAMVPLAATTYYFKDIQQLISDTFILHGERRMGILEELSESLLTPLRAANQMNSREVSYEIMTNIIAEKLADYLMRNISERREMLIADQAFKYEALLNEDIKSMVLNQQSQLNIKLHHCLEMANVEKPFQVASLIAGLIEHFEYEGLIKQGLTMDKRGYFDLFKDLLAQ